MKPFAQSGWPLVNFAAVGFVESDLEHCIASSRSRFCAISSSGRTAFLSAASGSLCRPRSMSVRIVTFRSSGNVLPISFSCTLA
jgi:hypothetical protein